MMLRIAIRRTVCGAAGGDYCSYAGGGIFASSDIEQRRRWISANAATIIFGRGGFFFGRSENSLEGVIACGPTRKRLPTGIGRNANLRCGISH